MHRGLVEVVFPWCATLRKYVHMAHEMTLKWLKQHCKENGGYGTPSLNDKLYLHFQGFDRIQNLEAYTGLKSLFLEGNGLEDLEGLQECKELRCLFAQQNMITSIPESLPVSLSTLHVSNTNLSRIENVARLVDLQTLQASKCKLKTLDSITELKHCAQLSTVDLQQNEIDGDPDSMVALFQSMPKLACLYLQGNPIVSSVRQYRKRMIASVPTLAYLDDRPVFELERVCAEAWAVGGLDAEKAARKAFKDEEEAKQKRDHQYLADLREKSKAKRDALAEKGKKALADLGLSDSDGEYEPEEEPPELGAARAKLAQYEARPGEEEPPELTAARAVASTQNKTDQGVSTRPWQPLWGPDKSAERNDTETTDEIGMLAGLSDMAGVAQESQGGQGRGGAAGRAAEVSKAETDENEAPSSFEKTTSAPVTDDTCLDELD